MEQKQNLVKDLFETISTAVDVPLEKIQLSSRISNDLKIVDIYDYFCLAEALETKFDLKVDIDAPDLAQLETVEDVLYLVYKNKK
jgi:acyl carrier protein